MAARFNCTVYEMRNPQDDVAEEVAEAPEVAPPVERDAEEDHDHIREHTHTTGYRVAVLNE